MPPYRSASGSVAEDLFIELFSETFGAEKAGYLYSQYHFYDIYQNSRYADFVLENGGRRIAIEIDDDGKDSAPQKKQRSIKFVMKNLPITTTASLVDIEVVEYGVPSKI